MEIVFINPGGEMLIKVIYNHHSYFVDGAPINRLELNQKIKDGNEILAFNEHGTEVTREVLARLIFREFVLTPQMGVILDLISQEVDEEVLYNVIYAGDIASYLARKQRQFFPPGALC